MSNKISTNENISYFDPNQIAGLTFDNSRDAVRVTLVGSDSIIVNGGSGPAASGPMQVINVPEIIREADVRQINVPVIIKEFEKVEVPVIITEYKTIEVPVVIREVQVVEIEKPIIVTEIKVIEKVIPITPLLVKICMVIQSLAVIGLLLTDIFLKGK